MNPLRRIVFRPNFLKIIRPFIGLFAVLAIFAFDGELRPVFFSGGYMKTILVHTVIVAIGAMGMTMVIVSGGIDLCAGSVVALTSVVAAKLVQQGVGAGSVLMVILLAGALIGLANGATITGFRMMPFIVTLGMMQIARGVAKWLADNTTVNLGLTPEEAGRLPVVRLMDISASPETFFPLPPGVWIMLGLAVAMTVMMRQSIFGRYIYAIGSNESTARLCGIRVKTCKMAIYALAGMFFGLAGLMMFSNLTQGDPSVAVGLELKIIAAVVIGGASLSGGTGSIPGSIVGAFMIACLEDGSRIKDWPNYMQEIIIGVVIILAVAMDKVEPLLQRLIRRETESGDAS